MPDKFLCPVKFLPWEGVRERSCTTCTSRVMSVGGPLMTPLVLSVGGPVLTPLLVLGSFE